VSWCKSPDAGLPQPDLVLFMDLSVEAASARGGFGGERYERSDFQLAVRATFESLRAEVEAGAPGLWQNVDAAGSVEEVAARIAPIVAAARARLAGGGEAAAAVRSLWSGAPLRG
jgi:dTMP kinase